jgi:hypothetical protein
MFFHKEIRNIYLLKMGSGISITKQQTIDIIRMELTRVYEESERNRRLVDDNGNLLPENFDEEEVYITRLRKLRIIERALLS